MSLSQNQTGSEEDGPQDSSVPAIDGGAPTNKFLNSLLPQDLESIAPHLRCRRLSMGQVVSERGDSVSVVHFVDSGIISSVIPMSDGHAVEACMVGSEGFTGIEACYGPAISATRLLVQAPGVSRTIDSEIFRRLIRASETLHESIAEYDWRLRAEIEQSVACNAVHRVEQRLAKWMLRCHDRHQGDAMELTQALLGTMLGTQRSTVNAAASKIRRSGAIKYSRGTVFVKNRALLEAAACDCYSSAVATRDQRNG